MGTKPSDLFLNVIEFFGVLVPGVLLYALHGDLIFSPFNLKPFNFEAPSGWIISFCTSYILGQILFVISEPLYNIIKFDKKKGKFFHKLIAYLFKYSWTTEDYLNQVKKSNQLPDNLRSNKDHIHIFYFVFNYVCIYSPNAITELERQASKYKLFRSLALFFFLELCFTIYKSVYDWELSDKIWIWLIGLCISVYLFIQLFDWTFQLALIYYHHLIKEKGKD